MFSSVDSYYKQNRLDQKWNLQIRSIDFALQKKKLGKGPEYDTKTGYRLDWWVARGDM
jgi:hypothetical protein